MDKNLSKEELKELKPVLAGLNTAIKNSALYAPGHPSFSGPIEMVQTFLDKWLFSKDKLDLGISRDGLFVNGKEIKSKDFLYSEIADYLHARGIITISIQKGIKLEELIDFFTFIRKDLPAIKEMGEIEKILPKSQHLGLITIDYSGLLGSAKEAVTGEEMDVWHSLINIARETEGAKIPESKVDFLSEFFKSPSKAALSLNRIYRDAVTKLDEDTALSDMQGTIAKIYSYFSKDSGKGAKKIKGDLLHVIARLHPDLVARIFERVSVKNREFDLAEEITKEFPDSFIADFIESLISAEHGFNENLLKVFDKLAPVGSSGGVASIIADKLFDKGLLKGASLSELQSSIQDMFKKHPKSDFMSEMYKITVDACVNRKIDRLNYIVKLSPLITRYVKSVKEEKLRREELDLLLNIMWLENDPDEIEKLSQKVKEVFLATLGERDIQGMREVVEFFAEKTRPGQWANKKIAANLEKVFKEIRSEEVIKKIISFIRDLRDESLENIVFILTKTKDVSIRLLVNAFIEEKNKTDRLKFNPIFLRLKELVVEEAVKRVETEEPFSQRDSFNILKEYAPEKTRAIARRLIADKNMKVRLEALEVFVPRTEEEMNAVFYMVKNEKNEELRDRAIAVLLAAGNKNIMAALFQYAGKFYVNREILLKMVELCGHMVVKESAEYLKKIFNKKSFFPSRTIDTLRIAAVSSLRRIDAVWAEDLIKIGLKDRSRYVREMCEMIHKIKS
ncbi:MAG: hypothetical protein ABH844_06625 [Candidatus Omnitrophota bacterium]